MAFYQGKVPVIGRINWKASCKVGRDALDRTSIQNKILMGCEACCEVS